MVIPEKTEIQNLLGSSRRALITARDNPGFDEVGSALAWMLFLGKKNLERVDVLLSLQNPNRYKWLPGFDRVRDTIQAADEFVIRVNVAKTKARQLSYDLDGDTLEIRVVPEGGNFTPADVSFAASSFSYDVILTLGAPELNALGGLFEKNRDLFFNTPIINIDRTSRNVRYGQVNAVQLTATSLAEISYACMDAMTPEIATNLLTGLIASTNSFQTPQVTPETLQLASELIVVGAKREEIIDRLYRTKDMDKMKVWGRVLSRLSKATDRIVYSDIAREDIEGKNIDLDTLVDELVMASPEADIVVFFYERALDETEVYVYARENYDVQTMLQQFSPIGTRKQVQFTVSRGRAVAESEVLDVLKSKIKLINR